jgi:DNA-binding transcriptional MerR regulator
MRTFRIQEFAKLAGVTERALHHYDRLKLLSPAHRSERGDRLYSRADLGRLERITQSQRKICFTRRCRDLLLYSIQFSKAGDSETRGLTCQYPIHQFRQIWYCGRKSSRPACRN